MAIAFLFEIPGVSVQDGERILQELGLTNQPPAGQILHIEGPMDGGGLRVVDVWESQEAFERFAQEQLMPAAQRAGVQFPPDFAPTAVWQVTQMLK